MIMFGLARSVLFVTNGAIVVITNFNQLYARANNER